MKEIPINLFVTIYLEREKKRERELLLVFIEEEPSEEDGLWHKLTGADREEGLS